LLTFALARATRKVTHEATTHNLLQ